MGRFFDRCPTLFKPAEAMWENVLKGNRGYGEAGFKNSFVRVCIGEYDVGSDIGKAVHTQSNFHPCR